MSHEIIFERLITYDAGAPGISIEIEIILGSASAKLDAKIDTGSTFCVLERAVGEILGIDIESGNFKIINTATGSFGVFGHNVTLIAAGFEFDAEVFFAKYEVFGRNILGRRGWLDQVIVGINDYDGHLYLSPYNSKQ